MAKIKSNFGLILIIGLGLVLRLINLNQSFWLDEATQAQMSSWSLDLIWSGRGGDFHPPLFYLLTHFWLQLGKSEIWLRLLPLIFGLVNIPVLYALARKIFSQSNFLVFGRTIRLDLLAALFLAINPFHIYYSQEFRSYSLLGLLGTLAMYLLFLRKFLLLGLVNALLLYTHYSSVFLILAQLTYLLFYHRTDLFVFIRSLLLSFLLYLPWLPQLATQLSAGVNIDTYFPGWRSILSVSTAKILPLTFFKLTAGRINFLSGFIYFPYAAFVLGCVFAAFRATKIRRQYLFNWVLVPVFAMIIFSLIFPQNQPFRVIYILPGLILIFVQACVRFPKLFLTLFLYIFLVGNISYYTRPRLQREQWRQAITYLQEQYSNTVTIINKFPDRFSPFYWYQPGLPVTAAVPHLPARPEDVTSSLAFLLSGSPRQVYVLDYLGELTDPNREVDQALLDMGFTKDKTINFEGVGFIHLFSRQ